MAKEKERLELEKLTQSAATKDTGDDIGGGDDDDENEAGSNIKLGVAEYYIAKRAAKKLKIFF